MITRNSKRNLTAVIAMKIMKAIIRPLMVIVISFAFLGCFEYKSVTDIYSHHFDFSPDTLHHKALPEDIRRSLPGDFQLANQLGFMATEIHNDGIIRYKGRGSNFRKSKVVISKAVRKRVKELESAGYKVTIPVQYPHVICYYGKNIDLIQRFENDASIDLFMDLNAIHNNDSLLEFQNLEIQNIIDSTLDVSKILQGIDNEILIKLEQEKFVNGCLNSVEKSIQKIDNELNDLGMSMISTNNRSSNLYDHIDLALIPIATKNDPLKQAHEKEQVDISDKTYNTSRTSINGYAMLDADMVKALDKLDQAMREPRKNLTNAGFSEAEISTLETWAKNIQRNKIQILSSARNAQHQVQITNGKKAKPLSTKHLIGVAVDFDFSGKAYDPKSDRSGYELFRKVAFHSGIDFPMPKDPVEQNHAVSSDYQDGSTTNKEKYYQKLASLLFEYNQAISLELSFQKGQIAGKNNAKDATMNKLQGLKDEVAHKLSTVNDINKRIEETKSKLESKKEEMIQKAIKLNTIKSEQESDSDNNSSEREYTGTSSSRSGTVKENNEKKSSGAGDKPKEKKNKEKPNEKKFNNVLH